MIMKIDDAFFSNKANLLLQGEDTGNPLQETQAIGFFLNQGTCHTCTYQRYYHQEN